MSDEIERDLATQICGCATEQQRRSDIKLIRAYGDQREREALEKAAEIARFWADPSVPERIEALIPKATP